TYSIWTSEDHQKTLEIPIFQGEAGRAQDNEYLGTLVVPDLPPGTKGNVVFDILFAISAESILTVTAEERGTARTVTATFSTQDTPDAVRRRLAGDGGEEPPPPLDDHTGKRPGRVKRLFGTWYGARMLALLAALLSLPPAALRRSAPPGLPAIRPHAIAAH